MRPLSADALSGFASWVQHESWEYVYDGADPSDMVNRFNLLANLNLDLYCPSKTIKPTNLFFSLSFSLLSISLLILPEGVVVGFQNFAWAPN